jgi:hypothetical protein
MADTLADAIRPFVSSWYADEYKPPNFTTEFWQYARQWDAGKFDPAKSLDLMRALNQSYSLGLTDSELAAGIAVFGREHIRKFGGGLTAESNPVAVAGESIMQALALRDGPNGYQAWWQTFSASGALQRGAAWTAKNAAEKIAEQTTQQRAASDYGQSDFADFMIDTGVPLIMAAATAGAFSDGGMFSAGALTGEAGALANTGYIDALGGLTDATGTALGGWSEMAATTAVSSAAPLVDTSYIDALGGMTDNTGTALSGWAESATTTATTGASNVDSLSDWLSNYSSDPGPDPFATTADVNAGWSYDGGYAGVDWYNSAGIGEASASSTLNDIFGNVSKALKSAGAILTGAQQLTASQNRVQPNLTRAAGQMNLALPLLIGAAFLAFRG